MLLLKGVTDIAAGDGRCSALFLQESQRTSGEGPKAENACGGHDLVMVTAQQILIILEEGFHLPAHSQNIDQGLGIQIQASAAPVADGLAWIGSIMAGDQERDRAKLADPGMNQVGVHGLAALCRRPSDWLPFLVGQLCSILKQLDPLLGTIEQGLTHEAVTFQPTTHLPPPFLGGSAHFSTVIPAIDQYVGMGVSNRFKRRNLFDRYLDFLWKGVPVASQSDFCRYSWGVTGQRCPNKT